MGEGKTREKQGRWGIERRGGGRRLGVIWEGRRKRGRGRRRESWIRLNQKRCQKQNSKRLLIIKYLFLFFHLFFFILSNGPLSLTHIHQLSDSLLEKMRDAAAEDIELVCFLSSFFSRPIFSPFSPSPLFLPFFPSPFPSPSSS